MNDEVRRYLEFPPTVAVTGSLPRAYQEILTPGALAFLACLERRFGENRRELLAKRADRREALARGALPDFLSGTRHIRDGDWTIAPTPADLQDRRVEITGPVERKMIINALNSGASVFMADFEDACTPTWTNLIDGQINLQDAVRGRIDFTAPGTGKRYELGDNPAVLKVRPRGWHLEEKHVTVDGEPMSASLFDFGLFFYHNAKALVDRGSGPYFYLPKMESHLEARLWNEVFTYAEEARGIPHGTIKATVLIEHILAAFETDEILYELRDHAAGLNCGRWDYIFSYIKTFAGDETRVLPDRGQVTMTVPFMRAYCQRVIQSCHRRGAHAMGGMAAQIPVKGDEAANADAFARVRADKEREAGDGHDGTWVAHPGLVPVARAVFDRLMPEPNQVARQRDDVTTTAARLIAPCHGSLTEEGLRHNVAVGIQYIDRWLGGSGAVPLYNLMEDAATAEICRTQLWQWRRHMAVLSNGKIVTDSFLRRCIAEEVTRLDGDPEEARTLFEDLVMAEDCPEFLTHGAYDRLVARGD